jgi:hypothetical protein
MLVPVSPETLLALFTKIVEEEELKLAVNN